MKFIFPFTRFNVSNNQIETIIKVPTFSKVYYSNFDLLKMDPNKNSLEYSQWEVFFKIY